MPRALFINLFSNNYNRKWSISAADKTIAATPYKLAAVIYHQRNRHFRAQVKIGGSWHIADDLRGGGGLGCRLVSGRHFVCASGGCGELDADYRPEEAAYLVYLRGESNSSS